MSLHFWLATGQTVMFLGIVGWAWWASCRIEDLTEAAKTIQAHSEQAAHRATRAAIDARTILDELRDESAILRTWWAAHSTPTDAPTQPQPVIGPDTVPQTQAIRLIDDLDLAWELARLEQVMRA